MEVVGSLCVRGRGGWTVRYRCHFENPEREAAEEAAAAAEAAEKAAAAAEARSSAADDGGEGAVAGEGSRRSTRRQTVSDF